MASQSGFKPTDPVPAFLGIDIGSETARVNLQVDKKAWGEGIDDTMVRPSTAISRYDKSNFSTRCNMTGDGEAYVSNGVPKGDKTSSVKVGLALKFRGELTPHQMSLDDSPFVGLLQKICNEGQAAIEQAIERATEALRALLRRIVTETEALVRMTGCQIVLISFTIPAQWGPEGNDFLRSEISMAFKLPPGFEIRCLTEIEAGARFYLDGSVVQYTSLWNNLNVDQDAPVQFCDFGGFSMNTCTYHIHTRDVDGKRTLCHLLIDNAEGETGGSGHWNYLFRLKCKDAKIGQQEDGTFDDEILQKFEDFFDQGKPGINSTDVFTVEACGYKIELTPDEARVMWDAAHLKTLRLFKKRITALKKHQTSNYLIVVSGGSASHLFMKESLLEIVRKVGIDPKKLIFTDLVDVWDPPSRLAKGLNRAMKTRMTVDEYIQRGGAWGVQIATWQGRSDTAALLLDSTGSKEYKFAIEAKESAYLRIVGCPFGDKKDVNGVMRLIVPPNSATYDMMDLGFFSAGEYSVSVHHYKQENSDSVNFVLQVRSRGEAGKAAAYLALPLRYNIGPGCVLFESDLESIQAEVQSFRRDLFGELEGVQEHLGCGTIQPEGDDEEFFDGDDPMDLDYEE